MSASLPCDEVNRRRAQLERSGDRWVVPSAQATAAWIGMTWLTTTTSVSAPRAVPARETLVVAGGGVNKGRSARSPRRPDPPECPPAGPRALDHL
jgi:hypothetical protein